MDAPTRRRFLRRFAAGAATAGLAGCSDLTADGSDGDGPGDRDVGRDRSGRGDAVPSPVPVRGTVREDRPRVPVRARDEYGDVVDVVEAGADPGGEAPIDDVLERVVGDDTLVSFPPGRYRIASTVDLPAFRGLGLVGRDATLVPDDGVGGVLFTLGRPGRASGLRFAGFEFDFENRATVPRPFIFRVDDGLLVRDVAVVGTSRAARVDVADAEGNGLVERLVLPGSPPDVYAVGCLVTDRTRGALAFRDCHVHGYPNNGLYASPSHGPVRVVGGSYVNNGIANVRVSGDSLVRGASVACDTTDERYENARGIWVRHGRGTVVEDCDVDLWRVHSSDGGITVGGACEVRNVRVRTDADGVPGLNVRGRSADDGDRSTRAADPDEPTAGRAAGDVTVEGLAVTGTAATGSAVRITDRDGCSFDSLRVRQTGRDRDGLTAIRAGEVAVEGGEVAVTGEPFRSRRASFDLADVRTRRVSGTDAGGESTAEN